TALGRAEQITWAAQLPVGFGDFEAVAGLFQDVELRHRFGCLFRTQQNAVRLMSATTDASPQLMQLRQPEAFRVLNQYHRRIWNIDTHLDHGRADQYLGF